MHHWMLISNLPHPSIDHVTTLLSQHYNRRRSLVVDSDSFIPNDLPVLEWLDLPIFSELFDTLWVPRLHTLIIRELYNIPFSRFPSLRSSIASNLCELHLPIQVPKALLGISFPLLQSLTLRHPLSHQRSYKIEDVGILNNLHCPRLRTLILNEPTSILSLNQLLSYPITRLDLVIRDNRVYHMLNSMPLLRLEDLRITDNSRSMSREILSLVKAKKSLRNVEVKTPSVEMLRELFRTERFPEELTVSFSECWLP